MNAILSHLLPSPADNVLRGPKLTWAVFVLLSLVSTARSLVHLLAPDGGAGSIAGMDLTSGGAEEIVFAFALWGSAQLIYAIIQLVVAFRYRSLVPLMYLLLAVETLLRMLVGAMRPVSFAHTPPGTTGNWIILPLAVGLTFWGGSRPNPKECPARKGAGG